MTTITRTETNTARAQKLATVILDIDEVNPWSVSAPTPSRAAAPRITSKVVGHGYYYGETTHRRWTITVPTSEAQAFFDAVELSRGVRWDDYYDDETETFDEEAYSADSAAGGEALSSLCQKYGN